MSWIWAQEQQHEMVVDEADQVRRSQRAVWHVLALIAMVELVLGGWIIGHVFK